MSARVLHRIERWCVLVVAMGCASETSRDASVSDVPRGDVVDAAASVTVDATADAPADAAADTAADTAADDAACGVCAEYTATPTSGRIDSTALGELSGIVESRRTPGVFFVHNDSGDTARFFAVNADGALLAEFRLAGATAVDWEDIAAGPCGDARCLYFGDIGDNEMVRAGYTVYRVREPEVPTTAPARVTPTDIAWDALPFRYPDGAHNAEALLAHPTTGDLYVITKVQTGSSAVFRFSSAAQGGAMATLEPVAMLNLPPTGAVLVTGGDLHPCARRLLVRTYVKLFEYEIDEGARFETIFTARPREVPAMVEPQGEAVGWRVDGRGYVTTSEGSRPRVNVYACEG